VGSSSQIASKICRGTLRDGEWEEKGTELEGQTFFRVGRERALPVEGGFLADGADTADPVFIDGLIVVGELLVLGLFRYGGACSCPGGAGCGGDGMMATDAGGGGGNGDGRGGDGVGHF
jgi:hypothetical protein